MGKTTTERTSPTLNVLEDRSRQRPLTDLEVLRLERAVRRTCARHEKWQWTRADVLRLRAHLLRGRRPKEIALMMKRTEMAVWSIMKRLGWTVKEAQLWVINPGPIEWESERNFKRKVPNGITDTEGAE